MKIIIDIPVDDLVDPISYRGRVIRCLRRVAEDFASRPHRDEPSGVVKLDPRLDRPNNIIGWAIKGVPKKSPKEGEVRQWRDF